MPSHVLFLIHGVGQRAPQGAADRPKAAVDAWPKAAIELLTTLAKKYAPDVEVSTKANTRGVRIVPLSYCDLIIQQIQAWDGFGADDVAESVAARFPGFDAVLTGLEGISGDDAPYFWGGPVDVLFYRLFIDRDVRAHVRKQIRDALDPHAPGGPPSCSFIAHSMGTSVLHDTLHELLSDANQFGGFVNLTVRLYASVANVSQVLKSIANPDTSAVRPRSVLDAGSRRGSVGVFMNVHHVADPVARIGLFNPPWPKDPRSYNDVSIDRLKFADVHGVVRYLEHPAVHIPIIETVTGEIVDQPTRDRALEEYDAMPGDQCPEALEDLREAIDRLRDAWDRQSGHGTMDVVRALVDGFRAIDDAREACGGQ